MRKKVIIGNWKMDNDKVETESFTQSAKLNLNEEIEVKVSPSFVNLEAAQKRTQQFDRSYCSSEYALRKEGAYTGEISYKMLKSININSK